MSAAVASRHLREMLVLAMLGGVLLFGAGCATHQRYVDPAVDRTSVERPARPIEEEESLSDRIGEVGVVLLVVLVTVGGILLPILLLA